MLYIVLAMQYQFNNPLLLNIPVYEHNYEIALRTTLRKYKVSYTSTPSQGTPFYAVYNITFLSIAQLLIVFESMSRVICLVPGQLSAQPLQGRGHGFLVATTGQLSLL